MFQKEIMKIVKQFLQVFMSIDKHLAGIEQVLKEGNKDKNSYGYKYIEP